MITFFQELYVSAITSEVTMATKTKTEYSIKPLEDEVNPDLYENLPKDQRVSARIPKAVYNLLLEKGISFQRAVDMILSDIYKENLK